MILSAANQRALYVPAGFAHGFQTLEHQADVFYQMSEFYEPEAARGVRWNDSALRSSRPEPVRLISDRDRTYPDFEPERQPEFSS